MSWQSKLDEWLLRHAWIVTVVTILLTMFNCTTARGADIERLTSDGYRKLAPTFTPDGTAVVFATHQIPNLVGLVKLDLESGEVTTVHESMTDHQFDAAYSRDGRWHCFARSSGSPQLFLSIHDLQEEKEYAFRPSGARSTIRTPQFIPGQTRILMTISAPGGQQIATVNLQGQDLKHLTQSRGINCWPVISPDGQTIAFCSSRDGNLQIYTMDVSGENIRSLTSGQFRNLRPSWSPDGQRIAFTSVQDGTHEIYVMQRDGTQILRVTDNDWRDDFPVWHPTGERLLIVSEQDGQSDLFLIPVPQNNDQ